MPKAEKNSNEESELQSEKFRFSIHANEIPRVSHYFYRESATYANKIQSILTDSRRHH